MTQATEKWFDSNQSLTVTSAILAVFIDQTQQRQWLYSKR